MKTEKEGGVLLRLSIRYLCHCLRKDKDYWYAWQSNIAMIIKDNYDKYFPLTTDRASPTFHEWCNICANEFLKLLTQKKETKLRESNPRKWHIVDKLISEGWHKDCPNNEEYKSLVEHHNAEVKDLECQVKDLEAKINDVYKKYSLWHKEAINMRMALQAISSGKIGRLACIDKARNALKGTD